MKLLRVLITASFALLLAGQALAQSLIRDTEIEETLREFGDPIIRAAGLNPKSVDIYIVNDPSLNAFVTRGQKVFFHTGILVEFETPNQLKGVMAHEVGHIASGHLARSSETQRSAYGTFLVAAGIGLAAILAGEGQAGAAILGSSQQFAVLDVLRYSRINESSADQAGANYLEISGQSGRGLIEFFEKFRYQEVMSEQGRFPYFRSHPLSSARIDNLREVVDESPYRDEIDSPEDIRRMQIMQAKLRGFIDPPQTTFTKFPSSDQSEAARLARAVAHFRAANLKEGLVSVDSLIEEFPDNPYYHELRGEILYKSGKARLAQPSLRNAIKLKSDAPLLKQALAQSLIDENSTDGIIEAVDLLKDVLQAEPENGYSWYLLSQAYGYQNKKGLAQYAVAEQAYARGDLRRATSFAARAMEQIPRDTPQYRRANDIVVISDAQLAQDSKRR
ncbi:M48 family metalloprotease [Robiginitomaculum antarcticum]|uniref:M48 family metalloprotease n=1 Tax=Robiginitomaculum antarcticum TaxID=437507 RepID=UPI00037BE488|nr:M48 family metalloprotease [Robiginitomaculum antarcticum]